MGSTSRRGDCVAGHGLWLGWKRRIRQRRLEQHSRSCQQHHLRGWRLFCHDAHLYRLHAGAAAASGSFSVKYPPPPMRSCSSWFAAYSALPEVAESVGGQYFYMVVGLKPGEYHGPGTYAIPLTSALEAVDLGAHQFGMIGAKLKVNADGSGSLSFSGAHGLLGEIDSGAIAGYHLDPLATLSTLPTSGSLS
ncbi:MAG: hypothetical protein ACLP36_09310 [Acidimicrobiales bacterium]